MFRVYALRTLDEDTIMKWFAIASCVALVALLALTLTIPKLTTPTMSPITSSKIYAALKTAGIIKGNKYLDWFFLVGGGVGLTSRITSQIARVVGRGIVVRIAAALATGPVGWAITAWTIAGF